MATSYLKLGSQQHAMIEEKYKKYDLHADVMLLYRFDLIMMKFKYYRDLSPRDYDWLWEMAALEDKNPIITLLASRLLLRKAYLDSLKSRRECVDN